MQAMQAVRLHHCGALLCAAELCSALLCAPAASLVAIGCGLRRRRWYVFMMALYTSAPLLLLPSLIGVLAPVLGLLRWCCGDATAGTAGVAWGSKDTRWWAGLSCALLAHPHAPQASVPATMRVVAGPDAPHKHARTQAGPSKAMPSA